MDEPRRSLGDQHFTIGLFVPNHLVAARACCAGLSIVTQAIQYSYTTKATAPERRAAHTKKYYGLQRR